MKQQFYRLFAFLLLSGALVIWSFSQLVSMLYPEQDSYVVNVEQLLNAGLPMPERTLIARQQLALPDSLSLLLEQGKTIALQHDPQTLFYYRSTDQPEQLLRLGPVASSRNNDDFLPVIVLTFYGCLALLAILLIWPVFRDLQRLQSKAIQFGDNPQRLQLTINKASAIYPLAQAFNAVANQIVELVDLHKSLSKTISHEVRTPLARMRFALELAESEMPKHYREQLSTDLDEIEQLATNYLCFAKLEYVRRDTPFPAVELAGFISQISQRFVVYQQKFNIQYSCNGHAACFDQAALMIAVQNLLSNAIRYAEQRITVHFEADASGWKVTTEDDGPGFSSDNLSVLDAFQRQQQDENGFGLGLYIVSQIASWHQAKVVVCQSASLGGASVSISTMPDTIDR